MKNKFEVYYKKELISRINDRLVIKQNISNKALKKIKKLHIERYKLFNMLKILKKSNKDYIKIHRKAVKDFEKIEFSLQKYWKFNLDSRMHDWYTIPNCTCGIDENKSLKGTDMRYHTDMCIVHGLSKHNKYYRVTKNKKTYISKFVYSILKECYVCTNVLTMKKLKKVKDFKFKEEYLISELTDFETKLLKHTRL